MERDATQTTGSDSKDQDRPGDRGAKITEKVTRTLGLNTDDDKKIDDELKRPPSDRSPLT